MGSTDDARRAARRLPGSPRPAVRGDQRQHGQIKEGQGQQRGKARLNRRQSRMPMATPMPASRSPASKTIFSTFTRSAPRAIRMPISRRRGSPNTPSGRRCRPSPGQAEKPQGAHRLGEPREKLPDPHVEVFLDGADVVKSADPRPASGPSGEAARPARPASPWD